MYTIDIVDILIAGFVLWFVFKWGEYYGRDKQRKADTVELRADAEQDPEK